MLGQAGKIVLVVRIAAGALVAALAIQMLAREFGSLSAADISRGLSRIGWPSVAMMTAATATAYLAVATYDGFALRYAGRRLGFRRSSLSSTSAYAVSNVLGFAVITGNAVRFWLFARWGLGAKDVAVVAVVTTLVCNVALALLIGSALLLSPPLIATVTGLAQPWAIAIGLPLVLIATALVLVGVAGPRTLNIGRLALHRPGPWLVPHILICFVDYLATAGVLYIPLSHTLGMDFPAFVALFSTAKLAGIASNVPAGLGVFEAVMAVSMVNAAPEALAAALIVYRVVFYLAPLAAATCMLAALAVLRRAESRPSPPSG
jgi:phosphatidylglycerol lysyltransferase